MTANPTSTYRRTDRAGPLRAPLFLFATPRNAALLHQLEKSHRPEDSDQALPSADAVRSGPPDQTWNERSTLPGKGPGALHEKPSGDCLELTT